MVERSARATNGRPAAPPDLAASGSTELTFADGATGVARQMPDNRLIRRIRTPHRPRLWFEVLLIAASYWLYSQIRNAVPQERTIALRHAQSVWDFERGIGLGFEHAINHGVNSVTWLVVPMNYYYAFLHFAITVSTLAWLYIRHPGRFGPARSVLFITTWLALFGFWLYPLAPPRLLPGAGFLDTVRLHHTLGSVSQGDLSQVSNQYAAMPSMHVGWSLWCGITIVTLARPLWVRILGGLYPMLTLVVTVSTGNHFWLDAVGGAACLATGYTVMYLVFGCWVYRLPRYPQPA